MAQRGLQGTLPLSEMTEDEPQTYELPLSVKTTARVSIRYVLSVFIEYFYDLFE